MKILTCSRPKTSPLEIEYSREYAIWPAAPVTRTRTGSFKEKKLFQFGD